MSYVITNIHFDISAINADGLTLVVVGYCIVFFALLLLYLFFRYLVPSILKIKVGKRFSDREQASEKDKEKKEITGEINAAISMALYLYMNELHDEESNVVTIKRVSKVYSPWSSKIYGLRNMG